MNYIEVETYEELSEMAAKIIAEHVNIKPESVLGLATGSTPLGTYECIANMVRENSTDFSKVTSVNLDEYVGLSAEHHQSYRYFMDVNLFDKINIKRERTFVPNGCAVDIKKECEEYDRRIEDLGGIDIQLLGIGLDGHIGFNEPDDVFTKETHQVELDPSTIDANSRFFSRREDVPRKAITMGMGAIMNSKKVLLIANGEGKRDIVYTAFFGPITPAVPASILQLHPDVTVIYSKK